MANMIPKDIKQIFSPNEGQKILYRIIRRNTPESWICYICQNSSYSHDLHFLLIVPEFGVIVICEDDKHLLNFTDFIQSSDGGKLGEKTYSDLPTLNFASARARSIANQLSISKSLHSNNNQLKFSVEYCVVMSNIDSEEFIQSSFLNNYTYSDVSYMNSILFKECLKSPKKITNYFIRSLNKIFNFSEQDILTKSDIQTIRGIIFPEIVAHSQGNLQYDASATLHTLTVEQEQIARGIGKNDEFPHRLLTGVAGCGKSIILRVRATDVAKQHPDWKILLTYFTRSLTNYLGNRLPRNIKTRTIGQVLYNTWLEIDDKETIFSLQSDEDWQKFVDVILKKQIAKEKFDAIFLDEAQDLLDCQVVFLRHLLNEKSNCAFFVSDNIQNIFRPTTINWKHHSFKFHGRTGNSGLSVNFRNTEEIFRYAWSFLDRIGEKTSKYRDIDALNDTYQKIEFSRHGPEPKVESFENHWKELHWIVDKIRDIVINDHVKPGDISILHPNATSNFPEISGLYTKYLIDKRIPCYWLTENDESKYNYTPEMNRVVFSTPESAKGLEWDIVFMPAIQRYKGDHPNNLRFVAATRARNVLYPSYSLRD